MSQRADWQACRDPLNDATRPAQMAALRHHVHGVSGWRCQSSASKRQHRPHARIGNQADACQASRCTGFTRPTTDSATYADAGSYARSSYRESVPQLAGCSQRSEICLEPHHTAAKEIWMRTRNELSATPSLPRELQPTHEEIEKRAYDLYHRRGAEIGRDIDDWLAAEAQLLEERRGQIVSV
jgi:hypothetical protein